MRVILLSIAFLFLAFSAQSQILKSAGVWYFLDVDSMAARPAVLPNGTELAYVIGTRKIYNWNRITSTWEEYGGGSAFNRDSIYFDTSIIGSGTIGDPWGVDSTLFATIAGVGDSIAAELSAYLPIADTAAMLLNYPSTAGYGIIDGGKTWRADTTSPNGLATRKYALSLPTSIAVNYIATSNGTNLVARNLFDNNTYVGVLNSKPFSLGQWTTAGRPTGVHLQMGGNTTTGFFEGYFTSQWENIITSTGAANGQVSIFSSAGKTYGTNSLFWDNANIRLGIGTNSPLYYLHIIRSLNGTVSAHALNQNSGTSATAGFVGENNVGSLGSIGISSSNYNILPVIGASSGFFFSNGAGGLSLVATGGSSTIRFASGGTSERMKLESSGNLLIGTSTDVATSILTARSTAKSSSPFPIHSTAESNAITGVENNWDWETGQGLRGYNGTRKFYLPESTVARFTSYQVPYPDVNGQLVGSANITFNGNTLALQGLNSSTNTAVFNVNSGQTQGFRIRSIASDGRSAIYGFNGDGETRLISTRGNYAGGGVGIGQNGSQGLHGISGNVIVTKSGRAAITGLYVGSDANNGKNLVIAGGGWITGTSGVGNVGGDAGFFDLATESSSGNILSGTRDVVRILAAGLQVRSANNSGGVPTNIDLSVSQSGVGVFTNTPGQELDINGDAYIRDSLRLTSTPAHASIAGLATFDGNKWVGMATLGTGLSYSGGVLSSTWLKPELAAANVRIDANSHSFRLDSISGFQLSASNHTSEIGDAHIAQIKKLNAAGTKYFDNYRQYDSRNTISNGTNVAAGPSYSNIFIYNRGSGEEYEWTDLHVLDTANNVFGHMYGARYASGLNAFRAIRPASGSAYRLTPAFDFSLPDAGNGSSGANVLGVRVGADSLFSVKQNGSIEADKYGAGNKEAADLSKTQSSYIASFATDGTVLDLERKRDTTIYIDDTDYDWSAAITTAQIARRYNRVIFWMTTTGAAGSDSELTLHTPDANLMQVEYLIHSVDEPAGFDNKIVFGTNNAVDSTNGLVTNYYPAAGDGIHIRAGLRSGVYKYRYSN